MKNKYILLIFSLCLVFFAGCNAKNENKNTFNRISADEAKRMMEINTDYIILDVRTQNEYDDEHITGAVLLPNEKIGKEEIEMLPDKEQLIFVYCRSGNRSQQASAKLAELGYTNVYEFGGINDWTYETD